jgi:hypothetical protein
VFVCELCSVLYVCVSFLIHALGSDSCLAVLSVYLRAPSLLFWLHVLFCC